jgi:hypothetical protein
VLEALSALPEGGQLEGGTPAHLLGMEGGDGLVLLADVGRPPVANMFKQAGEASVGGGVLVEQEARLVPTRLERAALARATASLGECPPEPCRPGRAELDGYLALQLDHPHQVGVSLGIREAAVPWYPSGLGCSRSEEVVVARLHREPVVFPDLHPSFPASAWGRPRA